jgi:hypothetical protein
MLNFFNTMDVGRVDSKRVLSHPLVTKMRPGEYACVVTEIGDDGLVMMTKLGAIILCIAQPGYEPTRYVGMYCEPSFSEAAGLGDFPCPYNVQPLKSDVDGKTIYWNRVRSVEMMDRILSCLEVVPQPA